MRVRRKHIRGLVTELLKKHGIDAPPVPIGEMIEAEGIRVSNRTVEDDVSGFLILQADQAIIGANKSHHINRRRFTLAHELGHYFLHADPENPLRVDRSTQIMLRSNLSSEGEILEEREANLFAAELLMPEHFLMVDWKNFAGEEVEVAIQTLARKYRVSAEAMQYRLTGLHFITF